MKFARNYFTIEEQQLLVDAIVQAEKKTSGEIRLHIENFCFGDELKTAMKVFNKLKMTDTNQRNAILIYMATVSRKVAVVGDIGIHEKLGNDFWNELVSKLTTQLRGEKKAQALAQAIVQCGEQLGKFFPKNESNPNELPDTISF
jgi:uncharacterized membrane protein